MSPVEKIACEWEARHDVAARGGRLPATPLQSYLSHCRCAELQRPGHPHAEHGHASLRNPADRYHDAGSVRAWIRWGEEQR